MGRKKRKPEKKKAERQSFTNSPFRNLDKTSLEHLQESLLEKEKSEKKPDTEPSPAEQESVKERPSGPEDDFESMMDGVVPIRQKLAQLKPVVQKPPSSMDESELVMRHLDDLVHGKADFDIADTDEYIEASVTGLDRRILKKLKKGVYSVEGHIDLHGMNRKEARVSIAEFINRAYKADKRCVLIIHGRGFGSKNHIPVLKEKLKSWLTRGAIGKKVLAYTSARSYDGGTGAVYVLLRS